MVKRSNSGSFHNPRAFNTYYEFAMMDFKYPSTIDETSIRLLQFVPSKSFPGLSNKLELLIKTHSIGHAPAYTALSYTWDLQKPTWRNTRRKI